MQKPEEAHNSTRNTGFGIKKTVSITGKSKYEQLDINQLLTFFVTAINKIL
jgi:hypothetical protein